MHRRRGQGCSLTEFLDLLQKRTHQSALAAPICATMLLCRQRCLVRIYTPCTKIRTSWSCHSNSSMILDSSNRTGTWSSVNTTLAVSLAGEAAAATRQRHTTQTSADRTTLRLVLPGPKAVWSFIALPSTAKSGDAVISKDCAANSPEGAHHTISADLPVVIVTEYGLADLRMVDDRTRVSQNVAD